MNVIFNGARVLDWEEKDFLVLSVQPEYLATPAKAVETCAFFVEALGGVRFVLLAPDSTGKPTLYGSAWLLRFLEERNLDTLDWRQIPLVIRD